MRIDNNRQQNTLEILECTTTTPIPSFINLSNDIELLIFDFVVIRQSKQIRKPST